MSASLAAEGKGRGSGEGVDVGGGATGAEGVAATSMLEELDSDQVKGRMLTMAGLFEIWKGDEVRLTPVWSCFPPVCRAKLDSKEFS